MLGRKTFLTCVQTHLKLKMSYLVSYLPSFVVLCLVIFVLLLLNDMKFNSLSLSLFLFFCKRIL